MGKLGRVVRLSECVIQTMMNWSYLVKQKGSGFFYVFVCLFLIGLFVHLFVLFSFGSYVDDYQVFFHIKFHITKKAEMIFI